MLSKRLINSNDAAAGGACTTNTNDYPTTNLAYYKMSSAADEKGTYNGTATNVNFNVAGKFGNAGEFNGSNAYVTTPYTISGNPQSFSFWIKAASGGTRRVICGDFSSSGTNGRILIELNGSNEIMIYIGNSSGTLWSGWTPQSFTSYLNSWTNLIVTVSGTEVKLYLNGTLISTQTSGQTMAAGANGLMIGGYGQTVLLWNGSIDQIRIFNSALNATQVTQLYNEVYCVPTIVPTDYFNTVLYTGTGSGSKSVTGVGFQPDLVWGKATDSGALSHILFDVVRGENKQISADLTDAEVVRASAAYEFDDYGFTVTTAGNLNNPNDFVAWCWKAGGAAVQNNDGTIQGVNCLVSANVDAGFSIVKHTGNGSTGTVGTGLSSAAELIIRKDLDAATDWWVYAPASPYYGYLNYIDGFQSANNAAYSYNQTTPTGTVFSVGDAYSGNVNNNNYIAYCFHSVDGYSKMGSYSGTGATGNTIVTGFRPAFVMFKRSSAAGSGGNWIIKDNKRDTVNPNTQNLYANLSALEENAYPVNFLSNGFEILETDVDINGSGATYIFMAFAEEGAPTVTRNATNPFGDSSEQALYKFEDNTTDSEGTYGTASNSGISYISSGYIDKSISFTGTTSTVNTTIPNAHTQTWAFWAKIPTSHTGDRIMSALNSSGDVGQGITYYSQSRLYIYDYIGGASISALDVAWANDGGWHHFTFSKNTTTSVIYVDGYQLGTLNAYSGNFQIGNNISFGKGAYGNTLVGLQLDQVRIFNRALDSGEVTALYNE